MCLAGRLGDCTQYASAVVFLRMKQAAAKADTAWRKSRLAARLLIRKESRALRPRERALAHRLSQDSEVTNRLIQQALYFLGVGSRKHAFDQRLVGGRD